jgi:alpha-L-fucosidase 2
VLRGAAEFCAAWLIEHEGELTTAPSTSPENHYLGGDGRPVAVGVGSTMDLTLTWELFRCVVAAADELGLEHDDVVARVRKLLSRLPSPPIGSRGGLLEWARDVPDAEPGHRHVSHLVGLHPGRRIDPERTPELAAAARQALIDRGDAGTGWSLAWKAALWARLGDGDRAGELLAMFLTDVTVDGAHGGGVYRNLFCSHPPFQIDGNFGITAAMAEMLLQSHTGELRLLPALPPEWRRGSVRGLRARGGLVADLTWDDGELTAVTLHGARSPRIVVVRYGDLRVDVEMTPGSRYVLDGGLVST